MKKLLIIALFCFVFMACSEPVYNLGMSENDFTSRHKWITTVVEKSVDRTVYKRLVDGNGNSMYYYFTDGKLTRIDEGERKPDVVIVHQ